MATSLAQALPSQCWVWGATTEAQSALLFYFAGEVKSLSDPTSGVWADRKLVRVQLSQRDYVPMAASKPQ